MTEGYDNDLQHIIFDRVDNPVVAHANPQALPALQLSRARRAGVLAEQSDCSLHAPSN